jgi:thiamine biosynthesis lipoprotein
MQDASRIANKLASLVDMGFERVDNEPVVTDAVRVDRGTFKVTTNRPAMGTLVSVSALARSSEKAEEAIGRAFDEMDRLIGMFSRFENSSAVTHLNKTGRLEDVPRELLYVVSRSLNFCELTGGNFDISVEPVVDLFRDSLTGELPVEPSPQEVKDALELVGSGNIAVSDRRIDFKKSGMGITLDGIAKGFIVDVVAGALDEHGIADYLINAGGDIRTAGTKEGKQPWIVAVQDPSKNGSFPDTIHLTDSAVATSGSYEVYFDRDRLYHHIVNSRSGMSPTFAASASVVAPSTMAADALATGTFTMTPHAAIAFIDSLPGCECFIVDDEGLQFKTKGWKSVAPINGEKAEA